MKQLLKKFVPVWAKDLLRKTKYSLFYQGENRYCPVCERSSSQFLPMVWDGVRYDAKCPYCHSFERHRLLYLFLRRKTDFFTGPKERRALHVAPEPCLSRIFRRELGKSYQTADMFDPAADLKMDICNIQFPDETFGVILCSHVLEHVPDDQKAMREFSRVLTRDGWAILLVPYMLEKTSEDPTLSREERERLYGRDHVRGYGPDYLDRLRANHFSVTNVTREEIASPEEIARMGLTSAAGDIVFCTKATSKV